MVFEHFPYTNFHDLNLDWMISKFNEMVDWAAALQADWEETKETYEGIETAFENIQETWTGLKAEVLALKTQINSEWTTQKAQINTEWTAKKTAIAAEVEDMVQDAVDTFQDQYDSLLEEFDAKFQEFVDAFETEYIVEKFGGSADRVVSQRAVTDEVKGIEKTVFAFVRDTKAGYIKSDGYITRTAADKDDFITSGPVYVKPGDKFKYKLRSEANTKAIIAVHYNYDCEDVQPDGVVTATGSWQEGEFTVPATYGFDKGYIIFSCNVSDVSDCYVYCSNVIPDVVSHAIGASGIVASVNGVDPDGSGNVQLDADDILTAAQQAAVNSGATAANIASIAGKYTLPADGIPISDWDEDAQDLINYLNDEAITDSPEYRGTVTSIGGLTPLKAQSKKGDFAGVTGSDVNNNATLTLYVFDGTDFWSFYTMPYNFLTTAQWSALNSGATSTNIAAIDGKYTLPQNGIPYNDLSSQVRGFLDNAAGAVVKGYTTAPADTDNLAMNAAGGTLKWSNVKLSDVERVNRKVTALSSSSTDEQYPSAKCVFDLIGDVETLLAAL